MKTVQRWIIIFFMLICLCGMGYSIYHIVIWKNHVENNQKIKKEIEDTIIIKIEEEEKIDFKKLKEINPDVVGYLKIKNTDIDYVVVKGTNNSYYLKHNLKKEYNIAGWIFADYKNMIDGNDKNLVIYGHDTKDGSMFGTLHNLLKKEVQEKNENEIVFITENETTTYQIFSTYIIEPEDYYIKTDIKDEEYNDFLTTIKNRSNYDYKINVGTEDNVLTLSTCTDNGKKRVVVHARKEKTE